MNFTSAEEKLRTLATMDATMQADLGSDPDTMRWYDRELLQNVIAKLPAGSAAVRVTRVGTLRGMNQGGIMNLSWPRFQIDVLSLDPTEARDVANDVIVFLGTINLCSNGQFQSPVVSPRQNPSIFLGQTAGIIPTPQPKSGPVYFERIDVRIANREDLSIN